MAKQKNYFVNFINVETNTISIGALVQAKCERSALFYINNTYLNPKRYISKDWKINRLVEINDKVYNRLKHLEELKKKKEQEEEKRKYEEYVKSGKAKKTKKELAKHINTFAKYIDHPNTFYDFYNNMPNF